MKKRFFSALLLCLVCIPAFTICARADSEATVSSLMLDIKNSVRGSVYNTELNAPFSKETSGINESVSTESGSMVVSNQFLTIPGRNGMDLTLTLIYSSQAAKLYDEGTVCTSLTSSATTTDYYEVYDSYGNWLRTGARTESSAAVTADGETWVYNGYTLSGTSIAANSSIANNLQARSVTDAAKYVFGVGWSLDLPSLAIDNDSIFVTLPDGQTYLADLSAWNGLSDYELYDISFSKYTSVVSGTEPSAYRLLYADGSADYFTEHGEILAQADRYGNTIRYIWTQTGGLRLLTQIIDTSGRNVYFEYSGNKICVKYDDEVITFIKSPAPGDSGKDCLIRYIDAIGRQTYYSYSFDNAGFDSLGKTAVNNTYANLTCAHYPTDFQSNYTYIKATKNLNASGYMDYFKVSQRWDSFGTKIYNKQQYLYFNEPDGYPVYDASNINENYRYYTTIVTENGVTERYYYNYKHQLTQKKTERGDATDIVKTEYDDNKNVPIRNETSVENKNGIFFKTIDTYTYDYRGNLVCENHPFKPEDEAGGEYATSYTYDTSYNLITSKSYRQDKEV